MHSGYTTKWSLIAAAGKLHVRAHFKRILITVGVGLSAAVNNESASREDELKRELAQHVRCVEELDATIGGLKSAAANPDVAEAVHAAVKEGLE